MNKEEILAVEAGRELDVMIAEKLFSAQIITKASRLSDKTFYALVGGEKEEYQPLEKGKTLANVWWRHTVEEAWDACPNYSTDISAAWEVVEKFYYSEIRKLNGCNWGVWFGRGDGHSRNVTSVTASEAICKAALLAVMDS